MISFSMFSNISYYFGFSENKEVMKIKKERPTEHKKPTRLYLKNKRLKKENETLKSKLRQIQQEVLEEELLKEG